MRIGLVAGGAAAVAAPASANGAYFPTSWGWAAIAFGWAAMVTLIVRGAFRLSRLERATLSALALLTGWIALSAAWSDAIPQTALEFERALVYLSALLALLLIATPKTTSQLLGGILVGITTICTYSLATRCFPERLGVFDAIGGNRLEQPIGYWNALGTFSAMGVLLALGFAARGRAPATRVLAGSSLPVLLPTLYFTFGRGAWISLGVGLLAAIALDRRRLHLITSAIVLLPAAAAGVWIASRSHALTSTLPALAQASREGHRLALILLGLIAATGLAAAALCHIERRIPALPRGRVAYAATIWIIVVSGTLLVFASYGMPWAIAQRSYRAFNRQSTPGQVSGANLNTRLFSLWGNGRPDLWRVAWRESREHPWLGSGAGTYEQYWLRYRPSALPVRDAHNLYLETLAELGPLGLVLLVVALALPLVAAVRARRQPLAAAGAGAYVVYLAHAGADWDWEVTAVTLTALLCAGALLVLDRDGDPKPISRRTRGGLIAVTVGIVSVAVVGLVSNIALSESAKATVTGNWSRAEAQARKATSWAPWSSQGWEALGQAQLEQGMLVKAQQSFRKGIAKDPHNWNLWLDLAFASTGKEKHAAALVASRLDPLSPEIGAVKPALGLRP
jgi:hypothetical protein